MNDASLVYRRDLLVPSESVDIFFELSERVQLKDLVAKIQCFDLSGRAISELSGVSFSRTLSRHYVYLRSPLHPAGVWTRSSISATSPIKSVNVHVSPWSKTLGYQLEDAVISLLIGASVAHESPGQNFNFVSIKGNHE